MNSGLERLEKVKKWFAAGLIVLLLWLASPWAMAYETREEMRAAYRATDLFMADSPYVAAPKVTAPHSAGELEPMAMEDALAYLNFLRELAGLEPVGLSRIYNYQCQHGAALLGALDYADHNAPRPADMDKNFYDSAHLATTSSNLAKFNWMRPTILREGIEYFARDDGEANLPLLGHRRWLLNPYMGETGFGLANSQAGLSYVVMYAHDFGNADAQWSEVCWPSAGAFPVELMHAELAWSVMLNPEVYDAEHSRIEVVLSEETMGLEFRFDCSAGTGDGFCTVNFDRYGAGPCVIFRPDFGGIEFTDYLQNQRWTVRVEGLRRIDGRDASIEYSVDMCSLYVQEVVNVEISMLEAQMRLGEELQLSAAVIPGYADDLSVQWSSSDETVALVDGLGRVTAVGPGACEIVVQSANGRSDWCALKVTE